MSPRLRGGARRRGASGRRLVVGHLFEDLLNLYGDRGNIATLVRRAAWRGIEVEVRRIGSATATADGAEVAAAVPPSHPLADVDIAFIGGGQDAQQVAVATGLEAIGAALVEAVRSGTALLAVCGGYQNLGHAYRSDLVGTLHGPGLLDVSTEAPSGAPRRVGGVVIELADGSPIAAAGHHSAAEAGYAGAERRLVGFENHSGLTHLGAGAQPLGRTLVGWGNNGSDGAEGLLALPGEGGFAGLRVGTYLHGPLLPRNPHLADYLISAGLARTGQPTELAPLPDADEWAAHAAFERRWRAEWDESQRRAHSRIGRLRDRVESLVGF